MADAAKLLPVHYCYFSFRHRGEKHDLRVWVTPSLNIEYKLYVNDNEVGTLLDEETNVLISSQCSKAFSYDTILVVYSRLLCQDKP